MAEYQIPLWLSWAREIQALAQTGLNYAVNDYQRERYQRLAEIAAEIISAHSGLDSTALGANFNSQVGYATPRVDVRGAVFQDGKLLLVRERNDGGWTLPGGWADVGEIPSKAAEREVWEEAGFQVRASRVIGVYDANRILPMEVFHAYKIIFLCDLITGEARPSKETSEVAFFAYHEIPDEFSGERTQLRHVQDSFAAYLDPHFQTVFD